MTDPTQWGTRFMPDAPPFPDFPTAAEAVVRHMRALLGFDLCMVTRTEGDDWIVLGADGRGAGVRPGQVFRWADSVCSRMAAGGGPRVAPAVADVPAYAAAPIARQLPVGAYAGVPLRRDDGTLFGTLCAVHPTPVDPRVAAAGPTVELFGRLLSSLLAADLKVGEADRSADRARAEAQTDPLTGLLNRRGWDQVVAAEEARCRRYGHPACVVALDLDGLKEANDTLGHDAGDALLRRAGRALRAAVRDTDVVARVGGDEFVVLAVETDPDGGAQVVWRLKEALRMAGVAASVGFAPRDPGRGLAAAAQAADHMMYSHKRKRKSGAIGVAPDRAPA